MATEQTLTPALSLLKGRGRMLWQATTTDAGASVVSPSPLNGERAGVRGENVLN